MSSSESPDPRDADVVEHHIDERRTYYFGHLLSESDRVSKKVVNFLENFADDMGLELHQLGNFLGSLLENFVTNLQEDFRNGHEPNLSQAKYEPVISLLKVKGWLK